jgi:hypothetical protein
MEEKPVEPIQKPSPAVPKTESPLIHQQNTHLDYKPYAYHLQHNDPNAKNYVASERDTYK